MFHLTCCGSCSFNLNLFHFGTSCFLDKLFLLIDITDMFGDSLRSYSKNLSHLFLACPNGIVVGIATKLYGSVGSLINDELIF